MTYNDIDYIKYKVWLGNSYAAGDKENLKKLGIKKIICIMDSPAPQYQESDGFNQIIYKIADFPTTNIIKYFGKCINFIEEGNENTFVHCLAGASRSASIVIAYIMWKDKMTFEDTLNFVKEKRNGVWPNFGFKEQLQKFEELLKKNDYDLNKIDFDNLPKFGKTEYYEW